MSGFDFNVAVEDGVCFGVSVNEGVHFNVTIPAVSAGGIVLSDIVWGVAPVEAPDGVLARFTLPDSAEYVTGKIMAIRDGITLLIGQGLTAVAGSRTEIDFDSAPETDEDVKLFFIKQP